MYAYNIYLFLVSSLSVRITAVETVRKQYYLTELYYLRSKVRGKPGPPSSPPSTHRHTPVPKPKHNTRVSPCTCTISRWSSDTLPLSPVMPCVSTAVENRPSVCPTVTSGDKHRMFPIHKWLVIWVTAWRAVIWEQWTATVVQMFSVFENQLVRDLLRKKRF